MLLVVRVNSGPINNRQTRLLWSQVDQANDYPSTKEDNQGNWEGIGDPGSEIETSACSEFAEGKKGVEDQYIHMIN